MTFHTKIFYLFFVSLICIVQPSLADPVVSQQSPTLLIAEKVSHDRDYDLYVAQGNVEIENSGTSLAADRVTYDASLDRVTATGNVVLRGVEGDVLFAEYFELSGSLKEGTAKEIRMILRDEAKLAAATVQRKKQENGLQSTFERAVYSPCRVCRAKPDNDPTWQVKAHKVVLDEEKQDIIYTDASLEMWGIPVFYTPYLSHPSPSVKRRSGLLSPTFGGDGSTGGFLAIPYYWAISPDKGLTLTPFYADRYPGLALDYDQRTSRGTLSLSGSGLSGRRDISKQYSSRFRGHLMGQGRFHMTPSWRVGFDVERSTDQTYLRRLSYFGLNHKSSLVSQGFLEWFSEKSYFALKGYSFQGLRKGDRSSETPVILPSLDFNYTSRPGSWGETWQFDANALSLYRAEGNSMQRLSVNGSVSLPWKGLWGDVYTFGTRLRGDVYYVEGLRRNGQSETTLEGGSASLFPQAYLHWRYPLIQLSEGTRFLIEPRMGLVAAPHSGHSDKRPNEDNLFFDFSHLNLMDESRFAGLDRLDSGSRFNYGLGSNLFFKSFDGHADFFFGQSVAFHQPREHLIGTGLEHKWSDYVGRLSLSYQDWVKIKMRTLFRRANLSPRRNELTLSVGPSAFRFSTDYILLPASVADPLDKKGEQIRFMAESQITDRWYLQANTTRQLGNGSSALSQGVGATYKDECFFFSTTLEKTFYQDRDIKPGVTLLFKLTFKNLGEVNQRL